jgi:hypothetical protein
MNKIRLSSGFAIASALCAAACSGAPGTPDPAGADTSAPSQGRSASAPHLPAPGGGLAKVVPLPGGDDAPKTGESGYPGQVGGGQGIHFVYRGGPVISKVKVYVVFWGSSVANQSALDGFYKTIADSVFVGQLSEYNTPTQKITPGQFVSSFVDTTAPMDSELDDSTVQQELANLIRGGSLPQPDANTLFMVHFPPGLTISMQGASSCQQFCAYHSSFQLGSGNVYYGILPDYSGSDCGHCAIDSNVFNDTTVVASHEVAEAITDPNIGVANTTRDESQLGWYDDVNDEIADVCEGQSLTLSGYRVTKLWSNRLNACAAPPTTGSR